MVYIMVLLSILISWGRDVQVSYDKLWKLLIDKKMKRTDLMSATGISSSSLAKLGKNESVSMGILKKICSVLRCNIGDIMDFIPEKREIE